MSTPVERATWRDNGTHDEFSALQARASPAAGTPKAETRCLPFPGAVGWGSRPTFQATPLSGRGLDLMGRGLGQEPPPPHSACGSARPAGGAAAFPTVRGAGAGLYNRTGYAAIPSAPSTLGQTAQAFQSAVTLVPLPGALLSASLCYPPTCTPFCWSLSPSRPLADQVCFFLSRALRVGSSPLPNLQCRWESEAQDTSLQPGASASLWQHWQARASRPRAGVGVERHCRYPRTLQGTPTGRADPGAMTAGAGVMEAQCSCTSSVQAGAGADGQIPLLGILSPGTEVHTGVLLSPRGVTEGGETQALARVTHG